MMSWLSISVGSKRLQVFPDVTVCDLGSDDNGVKNLKNARIEQHGRIPPGEYAEWKNSIGRRHKAIIWIDADEWWEISALIQTIKRLELDGQVLGHWRNLKIENNKTYASEIVCKGRFAWDTTKYMVGRTWPKERLYTLNKEDVPRPLPDTSIYAWHAIFLKRSNLPEDSARAEKRRLRMKQYSGLVWEELND